MIMATQETDTTITTTRDLGLHDPHCLIFASTLNMKTLLFFVTNLHIKSKKNIIILKAKYNHFESKYNHFLIKI